MSEYQYYEFRAIDRPLTEKEVRELRSYSTRAVITPTSFVNHYEWGNFKGDEDAWMEKYFDAFVYVANWGTHVLKLRIPASVLDIETAQEYCAGEAVTARQAKEHACVPQHSPDKSGCRHVIISMTSEDEEGDWEGEEEWFPSLIPLRTDIAHGDLRALYLGWLLCAQTGELSEDEIEPEVPPNLSKLSASLSLLASFLRIDTSLIAVAAQASPIEVSPNVASRRRPTPLAHRKDLEAWVAALSQNEKNQIVIGLLEGRVAETVNAIGGRFDRQRAPHVKAGQEQKLRSKTRLVERRTVGKLLRDTQRYSEEQRRATAIKEAKERERIEQERTLARGKYLDSLAGREPKLWTEVERLVVTLKPKCYDEALSILLNLRDLASRKNAENEFKQHLEILRNANERKPSFLKRLAKVGL
jgi:hypothetical protein